MAEEKEYLMKNDKISLADKQVHRPADDEVSDAFEAVLSISAVMSRLSKKDLITLIGELVLREPHLASVVGLAAGVKQVHSLDITALNRKVSRALNLHYPSDVEADLRRILRTAERLVGQGNWVGAGTVYEVVLDALTDSYEDELQGMDEDGDIACIARDCVDGLKKCLASGAIEQDRRRDWLTTMIDAELADVEMGGIDYAGDAMGVIFEYADERDWELLRSSIYERILDKDNWERERLVEILVAWEEKRGRKEQARQLIRELGTFEQQTFLKVEEGRPEEAVDLAKRHFQDKPGLVKELADALAKAGAGDHAATMLTELSGSKKAHYCYLEWLAGYYMHQNKPDMALVWQRRLFENDPDLTSFKALRKMARQMQEWPQIRDEALKKVEREKDVGLLIEIALDEKNVGRALELMPKLARWNRQDYQGKVARSAEAKHPGDALGIYREMAESIIEQRQRNQYNQAVKILCRMRDLHQRLDDGAGWTTYLAALKKRCARLSALKDELRKAGL